MKKFIYLLLLFALFGINQASSQVTIGSADKPDDSAILDLKQDADGTSKKGLLIPRVKLVETADPTPLSTFVEGLIVYNIESVNDVEHGFYYCDGSQWILLKPSDNVDIPLEPWLVAGTNEQATSVSENIYHIGEVLIGRSGATNPSAELEIYSDSRGFLMPRLTTVQRKAIPNPEESLMIWNIDESCYNFFAQGKWKSMCGDFETTENIAVVDCKDISVEGTYKVGQAFTDANYIKVTVQVSGPCNLRLEGETDDGFYFQRTGKVLTSGTFTYKIPAYGAPRKDGTVAVNINAYNNSKLVLTDCAKTVTVAPGIGTFSTITFVSAEPLTKGQSSAGKTMEVTVNVTTAGIFSFYSDVLNGVQYSSVNQDLIIGNNVVVLYSNGGIPITSATSLPIQYTISGAGGPDLKYASVVVNSVTANVNLFDCNKTKVVGDFIMGKATTTANYIECPVAFDDLGTWTGSTGTVDGLTFEGSGNVNKVGTQTIRLYATGTPSKVGNNTFTVTVNNAQCTATVPVLVPSKNILFIGNISTAVSLSLMDLNNFGPTGKSKISNINIIKAASNPNAATLAKLIDDNQIDIILSGWSFKPKDDAAQIIADFISKKKGFYFQVQSQGLQSYLKLILDKAYVADALDVSFTSDAMQLYAAIFPSSASIDALGQSFLNGVFGNCENKYIRSDDQNSWIGIVPTTQKAPLSSLMQLPINGNNPERNLFTYTENFFMIPDWGTLSDKYKNDGSYGTPSPISASTSSLQFNYLWDGTSYQQKVTLGIGQVVNWVLFGNVMDYIFKYTEENTIKTYKFNP